MVERAGHFHDTGAGTATPRSYQFAWNDDAIVANQFAGILTNASEAIGSELDTEVTGVPIVVFNPLNVAREDLVEAKGSFPHGENPKYVRVTDAGGRDVPSQIVNGNVAFVAKAPSVGYAVFNIHPFQHSTFKPELEFTNSSSQNAHHTFN